MVRVKDESGVGSKPSFLPKQPSVKLLLHKAGAIFGYEQVNSKPDPEPKSAAQSREVMGDLYPEQEYHVDELLGEFREQQAPTEHRTPKKPEPSERKAGERFGPIELPDSVKKKYDTKPMGTLPDADVSNAVSDETQGAREEAWFDAAEDDRQINEEPTDPTAATEDAPVQAGKRRWGILVAAALVGCGVLAGIWLKTWRSPSAKVEQGTAPVPTQVAKPSLPAAHTLPVASALSDSVPGSEAKGVPEPPENAGLATGQPSEQPMQVAPHARTPAPVRVPEVSSQQSGESDGPQPESERSGAAPSTLEELAPSAGAKTEQDGPQQGKPPTVSGESKEQKGRPGPEPKAPGKGVLTTRWH